MLDLPRGFCRALRQAKPTSLATFISAAEARDDSVKIRLGQEIQDLKLKDIFWHAKCYANYTSKANIMRVKKRKLTASASPSTVCESSAPTVSGESSNQTRGSRSQTSMTDWNKCLFKSPIQTNLISDRSKAVLLMWFIGLHFYLS